MTTPSLPPPLPPIEPSVLKEQKPSMLAWWASLPLILFFSIELIYGWPEVHRRQTDLPGAVGNEAGRCLAGLLISLVFGWIAFRISRRSQLTATVVFSVTMMLFCQSTLQNSRSGHTSLVGIAQLFGTPSKASFGDFSFEVPAGWKRYKSTHEKTVALLVLEGAIKDQPDGFVQVDVGQPALAADHEIAQKLAGKDGNVASTPTEVDGTQGVRVTIPSVDLSRPRYAVVVFHKDHVYLIMAAGTNGANVSDAFDEVVKTWRWIDHQ
jgi:hypothetical protein